MQDPDPFLYLVDDSPVILEEEDLGLYTTCEALIENISHAIQGGCRTNDLFVTIKGQKILLSDIAMDTTALTRQSLTSYLSHLNEHEAEERGIAAYFSETALGEKIVRYETKYFVVIDPRRENVHTPDPEDSYIHVPNEPFFAFARPRLTCPPNGTPQLSWEIAGIKDIDLSGRGVTIFNNFQSQINSTQPPFRIAAQ